MLWQREGLHFVEKFELQRGQYPHAHFVMAVLSSLFNQSITVLFVGHF